MNGEGKLGPRIDALAEAKGLDVTALSRASGLKEGTLYKLLRGDQDTTSFEAGLRLAKALRVDPWELAGVAPPSADFRAELRDGGNLSLDIRIDHPVDRQQQLRIREAFRAAVLTVFPGSSITDNDAAIKRGTHDHETESLGPSVGHLQAAQAQLIAEFERLRSRVEKLESAGEEGSQPGRS
jgi:transcriptional regulator with XRE-family HTH domain